MVFHKGVARVLALGALVIGCGPVGTGPNLVLDTPSSPTLMVLNDEFDNSASISDWLVRADVEGDASDGSASITANKLVLHPLQDRYFLDDRRGLSLFKTIDVAEFPRFMFETQVTAVDRASGGAPTEAFHSAGLVIYPDTARTSDWVVTNIGLQNGSLGFEEKSTVDNASTLTLYDIGELSGVVRLCVIDQVITVFTRLTTELTWTERNSFTHTIGPIVGAGVMVNDYLAGNEEVEGRFEYVRFSEVESVGDCQRASSSPVVVT